MTVLDNRNPDETVSGKPEELNFELALKRLETVVSKMQGSDLSLDESMALFQEGSYLVNICREKLEKAEQEVKILLQNKNGEIVEEDFLTEEA